MSERTPNPEPLSVTVVPTGPLVGEMPVILGSTVKVLELAEPPALVTVPLEASSVVPPRQTRQSGTNDAEFGFVDRKRQA